MESASQESVPWAGLIQELRGFVRSRVRDQTSAEDILQTALLNAHRQLQLGAEPESPRAWLYQIARNLIVDASRRERTRRALAEAYASEPGLDETELNADVDDADAYRLMAQIIPLFVAQLAAPYRRALELTELQGLSQAEAAKLEGVGLSAMKSRVQRGRRQLRAALERCCAFELDGRGRIQSAEPRSAHSCPESCSSEACP